MAKKDLLIVESPTKARTINSFLGNKYNVVASMGHVRDLPKSELGVDVEKNYKPVYKIPQKAKKHVKKLKDAFKKSKNVYLATDEDREGEAIAHHIAHILNGKKPKKKLSRIAFHEITEHAINEALENPRDINKNLVDSQQARRVLDRLVGYKLSPVLWKKIQYGLSAGRVQSVALRLIVERELERNKFKEQDYWLINSIFKGKDFEFPASLHTIDGKRLVVKSKSKKKKDKFLLDTKEKAKEAVKDLKTKDFSITSVKQKERNRKAYPAYTTSTLQQGASNIASFTSSRTMRAAQKLYENGHITYHRTDSVNLSKKFVNSASKFIKKEFGKEYYSKNKFKSKSKGAQEAHEAIRPTNINNKPADLKLGKDEAFVYGLIYARSLASLMKPIKTLTTRVEVSSGDDKYLFKATGSKLVFKGWAKAYDMENTVSYNPLSKDVLLPDLKKDTPVDLKKVEDEKKTTQPPARYSEASLIKTLESYGIGRPSTYAPTISTIQRRDYVNKEGNYFIPTDLGIIVVKLLKDHFSHIVDYDFTAEVEEELDHVALGEEDWVEVVDEFYKPFIKKVKDAEKNVKRDDYKILGDAPKDIKCPECGSKMVIKLGKRGKFYSCSKFPDCQGIRNLSGETEEDIKNKVNTADFKKTYKPAPKTEDGRDYELKKGRFGQFWAHPDYPKVKDTKQLEYKDKILKEKFGYPPKTEDGRDYVFKSGKYGPFWAHPDYPKVKKTQKVKKDGDSSK